VIAIAVFAETSGNLQMLTCLFLETEIIHNSLNSVKMYESLTICNGAKFKDDSKRICWLFSPVIITVDEPGNGRTGRQVIRFQRKPNKEIFQYFYKSHSLRNMGI
jgi:hypothetical protein